jgi:nitrite reductase/ring-hydroxylating ferredoxin subunit
MRTESGRVSVLDAICPHLGAHLGGGRILGERVACPMHGMHFDPQGKCTALPRGCTGKIPASLALRSYPVQEVDGFIMTWFDPANRPPTWELPKRTDLSSHSTKNWTLRTHVQETGEGSVDLNHLGSVHRYLEAAPLGQAEPEGPIFRNSYQLTRKTEPGMKGDKLRIEIRVALHGLGFSAIELTLPEYELTQHLWVLATPIDDETIDYRVAMAMHPFDQPALLHPVLSLLPRWGAWRLSRALTWRAFVKDVELDFPIWERKAYLARPMLIGGEGAISRYRRWATQFYEEGPRVLTRRE